MEEWKGVDRPLNHTARILKLWDGWGDDKCKVRFVVKRLTTERHKSRRKRRSHMESTRMTDGVLHPSAISKNSDIEKLMRTILAQGETIREQLEKLHEREKQIEIIEENVHDCRTKTSGKDYLLRACLLYTSDAADE